MPESAEPAAGGQHEGDEWYWTLREIAGKYLKPWPGIGDGNGGARMRQNAVEIDEQSNLCCH